MLCGLILLNKNHYAENGDPTHGAHASEREAPRKLLHGSPVISSCQ